MSYITNIDTISALLDRLISENIKLYFFRKEDVVDDIVETLEELIHNDITTGEGDRANLKEATSDNPSLEHFTRNHKLIRKANENRAVAKNKLDEQFKGFIDENNQS